MRSDRQGPRERELRPGDLISLRQGDLHRTVLLKELSHRRGPASAAQLLEESYQYLARTLKGRDEVVVFPGFFGFPASAAG